MVIPGFLSSSGEQLVPHKWCPGQVIDILHVAIEEVGLCRAAAYYNQPQAPILVEGQENSHLNWVISLPLVTYSLRVRGKHGGWQVHGKNGGTSAVYKSSLAMVECGHSLDAPEPHCQNVDKYSYMKPL